MKEALRQVKMELGDEAIILKSRRINRGGLFSFLSKEQIEVTAAVDNQPPVKPAAPSKPLHSGIRDNANNQSSRRDRLLLYDIRDDVQRIDGTLREIGEKLKYDSMPGLPPELSSYFTGMVDNGVDKKLAADLSQEVYKNLSLEDFGDQILVGKAVHHLLRSFFTVSGPLYFNSGKPSVVALIGPTGVGKTTTITKIASQYKFFANKKVALISADTYRLAAVEQLRTFARIASIPLEVVYESRDMPGAIDKHRDKELIIIDTAGRSHRDEEKMDELAEFMQAANPSEVHLTLSVGTKFSDLLDIIDRFKTVPSDYFLFTKLDETTDFGNLLNIAHDRPKPISMLTLGQNVPDDITIADTSILSNLVLSSSLEEAGISKGINVRPSAQTARTSVS